MCFTETATTEIYTLSLHDALPIYLRRRRRPERRVARYAWPAALGAAGVAWYGADSLRHRRESGHGYDLRGQLDVRSDRKSTRLNSSHSQISYAVFCLKKINLSDRK